jgi:hypothetical protein
LKLNNREKVIQIKLELTNLSATLVINQGDDAEDGNFHDPVEELKVGRRIRIILKTRTKQSKSHQICVNTIKTTYQENARSPSKKLSTGDQFTFQHTPRKLVDVRIVDGEEEERQKERDCPSCHY